MRGRLRRGLILLVLVAGGLGLALVSFWQAVAVPWAEQRLSRAIGHRAQIGSLSLLLSLSGTRVRARNVTVFGAAPFSGTPLARIASLEIRLGGPGYGMLQPSMVSAEGVQVTYLRSGGLDNLARPVPGGRTPPTRTGASPRPALVIRDGRFEAFVRLGNRRSLVARSGKVQVDRPPGGPLRAEVESVTADLPGLATLATARIRITATRAHRTVQGDGLRVELPGGGTLVDRLALFADLGPESGRVSLQRVAGGPDDGSPTVTAKLELVAGAAQGVLEIPRLPLTALRPIARRLGIETGVAEAKLKLVLTAEPEGRSHVRLDLEAEKLGFAHPRLDRGYWGGLGFALHGQALIDFQGDRIEVEPSQLTALGLNLLVSGWSERLPRWRGEWKIETPTSNPTRCEPLLQAQAEPIRRALAGLALSGNLGLAAGVRFDSATWENLALSVEVQPRCVVEREPTVVQNLQLALAGAMPWPELPITRHHPDFVPYAEMPRHLLAAFMTAEDARFFSHRGFDLEMIRRALAHDLAVGAVVKGASTITQQLAKNLFLGPERTLARKLAELVLSWRLHETLEKRRQLELYLNAIELGPGIRGVKQAAHAYFGKAVSKLTPLESAHLAALTPNPVGFARRFREGRVDEGWLHRLYDLLGMMNRSGRLSAAELNSARQSRLTLRRI